MSARQVERLRKRQAERQQARAAVREAEREDTGEPIVHRDAVGRVLRVIPPSRRAQP